MGDESQKLTFPCWCGCSKRARRRFARGHDAKFHGRTRKVIRGELQLEACLAELPHDRARDYFRKHVEMDIAIRKLETRTPIAKPTINARGTDVTITCPCGMVLGVSTYVRLDHCRCHCGRVYGGYPHRARMTHVVVFERGAPGPSYRLAVTEITQ